MSSKYILISQVEVLPGKLTETIARCHAHYNKEKESYRIYNRYEGNSTSLLILTALGGSLNYLNEMSNKKYVPNDIDCHEYLVSDWKMQILKLEESVIDLDDELPKSDFLQLRHIEVPLNKYSKYLAWRKKTIFDHVLQQTQIECFLSYHSFISTEPGVMFLSGFSCFPEEYLKIFKNDEYEKIVKVTGNQFIAGGQRGLYASIYQRSYH